MLFTGTPPYFFDREPPHLPHIFLAHTHWLTQTLHYHYKDFSRCYGFWWLFKGYRIRLSCTLRKVGLAWVNAPPRPARQCTVVHWTNIPLRVPSWTTGRDFPQLAETKKIKSFDPLFLTKYNPTMTLPGGPARGTVSYKGVYNDNDKRSYRG